MQELVKDDMYYNCGTGHVYYVKEINLDAFDYYCTLVKPQELNYLLLSQFYGI